MTTDTIDHSNEADWFPDRREILQLSLQALLFGLAAKCVGLGWLAARVQQQRQIVAWLQRNQGNGCYWDSLELLETCSTGSKRSWVKELLGEEYASGIKSVHLGSIGEAPPPGWPASLTDLTELTVTGPLAGGLETWRQIANLPSLRWVSAFDFSISDAELALIARMPRLEMLTVNDSTLTGSSFEGGPSVWSLNLNKTWVGDAFLPRLETLPRLSHLSLGNTCVTDAGLKELTHLPLLRGLHVHQNEIGDAGLLGAVNANPQLEELAITRTRASPAGLLTLPENLSLQRLYACHMALGDEHVAGLLERFPAIDHLWLSGEPLTGNFAERMRAPCPGMQFLSLTGVPVTDEHLPHLAKAFPNLFLVNLNGTRITDRGLSAFQGWSRDIAVFVGGTQVTAAGAKSIHAADPNVSVCVPHGYEFAVG